VAICIGLFQIVKALICRQVTVYCMLKDRPQHPRNPRREHLMVNFTFRRVSYQLPFREKSDQIILIILKRIAEEANRTFSTLLRSELFHNEIPQSTPASLSTRNSAVREARARTPPTSNGSSTKAPSTPSKNLFTYMSPKTRTPQTRHGPKVDTRSEIYSLSPVRFDSQRMLLSPRKQPRTVSKVPYKVLDAPELADDFYLNLVDWGSTNILGVGLGSCVYMWNSASGMVTKLCDLGADDTVTSVSWIQRVSSRLFLTNFSENADNFCQGSHVSIGTNKGYVQIWDAKECRRLRVMTGHTARVGTFRPCKPFGATVNLIRSSCLERPHFDIRFEGPYNISSRCTSACSICCKTVRAQAGSLWFEVELRGWSTCVWWKRQ